MTPALVTQALSKAFGGNQAVADLDLRVAKGTVFGLLGPNGAGKTTTIKMILGLVRPDIGHVRINGACVQRERKRALARVGSIVEAPALYANLTGRETLQLARLLTKHECMAPDEALSLMDLGEAADRPVGGYSLGMKQRLALARALIGRPELLLVDEPTNGLDPQGVIAMRSLLKDLPERFGVTVILSSHMLSEVERVADHCALMNKGRLVRQDRVATLISETPRATLVETERPGAVIQFLQKKGLTAKADGDLVKISNPLSRVDRANLLSAFQNTGLVVSSLWREPASLEDFFLSALSENEDT